MFEPIAVISIIFTYLLGSISSAILISQWFSLPNPLHEGSKNPGTTNMLRLAGKKYAFMVLLIDVAKGLLPLTIAQLNHASYHLMGLLALSAILGHIFPIYFKFKGGKGVATALGALLGFHFALGLLTAMTWLAIAKLTRFSSLAALAAISAAPFYLYFLFKQDAGFWPLMSIAALIVYRHRENVVRLLEGTETKISF